jgi:cytochrome c biogenesis protein
LLPTPLLKGEGLEDEGASFTEMTASKTSAYVLLCMVILFTIIIACEIAGTLLPQQDIYGSVLFKALWSLLTLILVITIIRQIARLRHSLRYQPSQSPDLEHLPSFERIPIAEPSPLTTRHLTGLRSTVLNDRTLYGYRHRAGHAGPLLVHIAVLLMVIGYAIGDLRGFSETVEVFEGHTNRVPHTDLALRLDSFTIAYYEGSRMPREYRSQVTLFSEDTEVMQQAILVNHPLSYGGVRFYQMDYGTGDIPDRLTLAVLQHDSLLAQPTLELGESKELPGLRLSLKYQDLIIEPMGRERGAWKARIELRRPSGQATWIDLAPEEERSADGVTLSIADFHLPVYSGLEVARDPGVLLIWAGMILLVIGLPLSLFLEPFSIWVHRTDSEILVASSTPRASPRSSHLYERVVDHIRRAYGG